MEYNSIEVASFVTVEDVENTGSVEKAVNEYNKYQTESSVSAFKEILHGGK